MIWAEDGAVFLSNAYSTRFYGVVLDPYAGYANPLPRLSSELASWLPITWQGTALTLMAAACEAMAATFVFWVVAAHARSLLAAALSAAEVAAVPLGFEVVDNVSNVQWYALAAGVIAVFWCPRTSFGKVMQVAALFTAAVSSPFGGGVALVAVGVFAVVRDRRSASCAVAAVGGVGVQLAVMAGAERGAPLSRRVDVTQLGSGYVRHVVGDGFLGAARHGTSLTEGSARAGIVMVLLLAVLALSAASAVPRQLIIVVILWSGSVACFALPVALNQTDLASAVADGRYFVAPAMLLTSGAAILCARSWRQGRLPVWARRLLVGTVSAAAVVGLVSSWQVPSGDPRRDAPGWAASVDDARKACPRKSAVLLPIQPPGFVVGVPCAELAR